MTTQALPEEPDLPDDPMMRTLTDALRAGPGSLEWRKAVDAVRDPDSTAATDEHRLLITARERLESGKSYREVRPGPGFTRSVMSAIDADEAKKPKRLRASFLAYLLVTLIVGGVGVLVFRLVSAGNFGNTIDLTTVDLQRTVLSTRLDGPLAGGFKVFGTLPIDVAHGLALGDVPAGKVGLGGGIVSATGIASEEVFAVQATFKVQQGDSDLMAELFVTAQPDFGPGSAVTPHELAWLIKNGKSRVSAVDGAMTDESARLADGSTVDVKIVVGPTDALVQVNGKTVWTGPHKWGGNTRFVGVRMIRQGTGGRRDAVVVQSLKVLEK